MSARHRGAKGYSPLIWFGALFLTASAAITSCAVSEPASVEGTWVITDSVSPGFSAMQPEEAKTWLGKSFQYSADNVILGQTQCGPAKWDEKKLSEKDFQQEYRVSFEQLGIVANKISRFEVDCHGENVPGQSVLVAARDRAFTVWDGVFFQMEKAEAVPQ